MNRYFSCLIFFVFAQQAFPVVAGAHSSANRSCETWQARALRLGQPVTANTASVGEDSEVSVFTAPSATCRCVSAALKPHSVVSVDRRYNGFVRVLYLNASNQEQVSGWVQSQHIHALPVGASM